MNIKLHILFYIYFLININTIFAQKNIDNFEYIIENNKINKPISNKNTYSLIYKTTKPQETPNWIQNIPACTNKYIYAIGVSNPDSDSLQGINYAIKRAELMASMFYKSTIQQLCSYFLNEDVSSNVIYENYAQITTNIKFNKYNVEKVFTNKYNETIVLVKFNIKSIKETNYNSTLSIYKNEFNTVTTEQLETIYEFYQTKNKDTLMFYQTTNIGNHIEVLNKINNKTIKIPIYNLSYITTSDTVLNYKILSHGLWNNIFKSTIDVIIKKAREKPETLRNLGDKYQSKSYQKLTHGIAKNTISLRLTNIGINKKGVTVKVYEPQNKK